MRKQCDGYNFALPISPPHHQDEKKTCDSRIKNHNDLIQDTTENILWT